MLEVPVYDMQGNKLESMQVDEARLGGEVNPALLKQAMVAYHTNTHQGSAATRSRGMVSGSGKKLFRQKGTGNARRGTLRTNKVRGGGVAFAKVPHRVRHDMPKKMRRKALQTAVLAKILGSDMVVVDGLTLDTPKTKTVVNLLQKMEINRSCVMALGQRDDVIYRSARNIPKMAVRTVGELNAFVVAQKQKMVVTREAMNTLLGEAEAN